MLKEKYRNDDETRSKSKSYCFVNGVYASWFVVRLMVNGNTRQGNLTTLSAALSKQKLHGVRKVHKVPIRSSESRAADANLSRIVRDV